MFTERSPYHKYIHDRLGDNAPAQTDGFIYIRYICLLLPPSKRKSSLDVSVHMSHVCLCVCAIAAHALSYHRTESNSPSVSVYRLALRLTLVSIFTQLSRGICPYYVNYCLSFGRCTRNNGSILKTKQVNRFSDAVCGVRALCVGERLSAKQNNKVDLDEKRFIVPLAAPPLTIPPPPIMSPPPSKISFPENGFCFQLLSLPGLFVRN